MGFLLLQYEFQRANREVNLCHRKGIRIDNQLTTATRRVEKMQSVFSKEKSALDTSWNNKKSAMTQGLGQLSMQITQACGSNPVSACTMFEAAMRGIIIAGIPLSSLVSLPSIDTSSAGGDPTKTNQIIMTAITTAVGQAQQMINTLADQAKSVDEAALELKQDAQLQPLSDKESDIQAEKSLNDVLTDLWTERKENAKGKLPDAIKDSMSGFGLK